MITLRMLTETASFHMRDHHPMLGWGPHWCPPLLHAQNLHWAACDSAAFWQGEPRIIADWGCKHARLEQHEAAPAGLLVQVQALGCCSDTCMRTLFLALGRRFCLPGPCFCRSCSCWYQVDALSVPMRPRPYSSLHRLKQ